MTFATQHGRRNTTHVRWVAPLIMGSLLIVQTPLASALPMGSCQWLHNVGRAVGILKPNVVEEAMAEFPELSGMYSPAAIDNAHQQYLIMAKRFPRYFSKERSAIKRFEPFLDVEKYVQTPSMSAAEMGNLTLKWEYPERMFGYLYGRLPGMQSRGSELWRWLLAHHPFLRGVREVSNRPGTVVTLAFEKETHEGPVADWYRPRSVSEEKWFKLSPAERTERLWASSEAFFRRGMVPTSRLPKFLSNAKFERPMLILGTAQYSKGKPPIEFTSDGFEVSLRQIHDELRTVGGEFPDYSAIHLHNVIPFSKSDLASWGRFSKWWLKLNRYLYLYGIERGLHPSALAKLPLSYQLPSSPDEVTTSNFKYFQAGMRGSIYGEAPTRSDIMIGVELRDVARTGDDWEFVSKRVYQSMSDQIWNEGFGAEESSFDLVDEAEAAMLHFERSAKEVGIPAKVLAILRELEPMVGLPYVPFESKEWPLGTPRLGSAVQAREKYLQDIRDVVADVVKFAARGEDVEDDILRMAIRMSLTDWAKAVRPSGLLHDF